MNDSEQKTLACASTDVAQKSEAVMQRFLSKIYLIEATKKNATMICNFGGWPFARLLNIHFSITHIDSFK